jgi:GNAT superfamily N-acetyltransferase
MGTVISSIRPAEVPKLLKLIRELAAFEKLEQEVEATEELLHRALFEEPPHASALVAHVDNEGAGYALYFMTFSTFTGRPGIWLDDLYVRPQFRKQGLGSKLMNQIAAIGLERGCQRFEWTALKWNQAALDFYERLGAKTMDEWVVLRLNAENLRKLVRAAE